MNEQQTLYCPSCGEVSEIESVEFPEVAPGSSELCFVICPNCNTLWRITILVQFHEAEELCDE